MRDFTKPMRLEIIVEIGGRTQRDRRHLVDEAVMVAPVGRVEHHPLAEAVKADVILQLPAENCVVRLVRRRERGRGYRLEPLQEGRRFRRLPIQRHNADLIELRVIIVNAGLARKQRRLLEQRRPIVVHQRVEVFHRSGNGR